MTLASKTSRLDKCYTAANYQAGVLTERRDQYGQNVDFSCQLFIIKAG